MTLDIPQTLLEAAFQRARSCTAAFHYKRPGQPEEIGSAVLIAHKGKTFALTCEHIVRDISRAEFGELVVGDGAGVPAISCSKLRVVGICSSSDIALVEVLEQLPSTIRPRDISEFERVPDFRTIEANRRGFAVIGFPASAVTGNGTQRTLRPLIYFTVDSTTMPQEEKFLYLAFREGLDSPPSLPPPYGLSGSCVLAFDKLEPTSDVLFKYGRIIAIQTDRGPHDQYIKCSSLDKLFEWLDVPVAQVA